MLRKKVPAYVPLVSLLLGSGLAALVLGFSGGEERTVPVKVVDKNCEMRIQRLRGYSTIKPLFSSEHVCESERFGSIKQNVGAFLQTQKVNGVITDAGFYLRDFRRADWTMYNGEIPFEPGSLMKIPFLITYLRMAERDPTVMSRTYSLPKGTPPLKHVFFEPSASMKEGEPYTVAQLLDLAITHSDNHAVNVLLKNIDMPLFHRTFTDLGLPDIQRSATSYPLSAKDLSMFMKAIYNATYLSLDDSELAVSMLMAAEFADGLKAGIPADVRIAHKFGESFDGTDMQLHETALIYAGADAYLLTVMTKGPRIEELPAVLASVSKLVYEDMIRLNGAVQ